MLECRYYGNCYFMECDVPDKCDGNGNCESYRHGHEIKTACQFYSSMPDVESLLAMADEMDNPLRQAVWNQTPGVRREHIMSSYASRIREALGVQDA